MVVAPPLFKAKTNDSEDWIEKIYAQKDKIDEFEDNAYKTIAKIRKMCTNTI